jgi:hypothetical protein|nr:MAG TPA: hypothetical protein [Caudoviricetes sp.]
MKVIWQSTLEVEKLVSNAERALQCQISRGFKARLEKEAKRERFLDAIAKGISDLILGCVVFGSLAIALYFGSK